MSVKVTIDVQSLAAEFKTFKEEAQVEFTKAVEGLASMTRAMTAELASQELHSSLKQFQENLFFDQIADNIWVVSIGEKAMWIEEGLKAGFDMKPGLLKDAKTGADGQKYAFVPFEHSKPPTQMNGYAQNLVGRIKSELKGQGVPFKKIEKNESGSPRVGLIHEFDFGGEKPGKGNTPVMDRLRVYQTPTASGGVRRDIFTFRTVKSGQDGKWLHPGIEAHSFLDRALEKAMKEWETVILPNLIEKLTKRWE